MVVTRVTYSFFKKSSNGIAARLIRKETVDLIGAREKDITRTFKNAKGEKFRDIADDFEVLLLAEMGLIKDNFYEEYDYFTVNMYEYEQPADDEEFTEVEDEEDEEEADEDEEEEEDEDGDEVELDERKLVVEIDPKTGKAKVFSKGK